MSDFALRVGDTGPPIEATLTTGDGEPVGVRGASVRFHLTADVGDPDATVVNAAATVLDADAGRVRYEWRDGDTAEPGVYYAEWEVTYAEGGVESFPNDGWVEVHVLPAVA